MEEIRSYITTRNSYFFENPNEGLNYAAEANSVVSCRVFFTL